MIGGKCKDIVSALFGEMKRNDIDNMVCYCLFRKVLFNLFFQVNDWILRNIRKTWKIVWINWDEYYCPNNGKFTLVSNTGIIGKASLFCFFFNFKGICYSLIISTKPAILLRADVRFLSKGNCLFIFKNLESKNGI